MNVGSNAEWRGLLDTAAQLGVYCWVERRLFEMTGGWVRSEEDPRIKVALAAQSQKHARHAEMLFDRIPELSEIDAEALVSPPSPQMVEVFRQVEEQTTLAHRVVGSQRVILGKLVSTYRKELRDLDEIANASTRRCLTLIMGDLVEERLQADETIDRSVLADSNIEELLVYQLQVENQLLAAGGLRV